MMRKKFLTWVAAVMTTLALTLCVVAVSHNSTRGAQASQTASGARVSSKIIDAAQLLADVKTLADDKMEGRRAGTPGGARARNYIAGRFREAGVKPFGVSYEQPVKLSPERDGGGANGANVVGYIVGKDASMSLFVTAHYDHLGVKNGQIYNGADDNASGVAALLQIAAYFRHHQPAHTIVFATLDAEEGSGAGARTLVSSPPVKKESIVLDVNLDMVSHNNRDELYAVGTYHYPYLKPYLEQAAARAPIKLLIGHDRPEQGHDDWTTQSDQVAFHREKIPFVYFGVEDHKDYHKPTDDFETITQSFFVCATETILDVVKLLDGDLQSIASKRAR